MALAGNKTALKFVVRNRTRTQISNSQSDLKFANLPVTKNKFLKSCQVPVLRSASTCFIVVLLFLFSFFLEIALYFII